MREIKFRAKKLYEDKWIYGQYAYIDDKPAILIDSIEWIDGSELCGTCWDNVDKSTVCQFTGLHDANGKEIYEGDIIESSFGGGIPARHFVGYDEKEAAFTANLIGAYPNSGSIRQSWIDQYGKKVVGNIHDNKLEDFK